MRFSDFVATGIEYQYSAATIAQARKAYSRSCEICCRCYRADCGKCPLPEVHRNALAILDANKRK